MADKRAEAPGAWADSNQPVPRWLTQWQVELKSSIDTPFRLEQPSMPDQDPIDYVAEARKFLLNEAIKRDLLPSEIQALEQRCAEVERRMWKQSSEETTYGIAICQALGMDRCDHDMHVALMTQDLFEQEQDSLHDMRRRRQQEICARDASVKERVERFAASREGRAIENGHHPSIESKPLTPDIYVKIRPLRRLGQAQLAAEKAQTGILSPAAATAAAVIATTATASVLKCSEPGVSPCARPTPRLKLSSKSQEQNPTPGSADPLPQEDLAFLSDSPHAGEQKPRTRDTTNSTNDLTDPHHTVDEPRRRRLGRMTSTSDYEGPTAAPSTPSPQPVRALQSFQSFGSEVNFGPGMGSAMHVGVGFGQSHAPTQNAPHSDSRRKPTGHSRLQNKELPHEESISSSSGGNGCIAGASLFASFAKADTATGRATIAESVRELAAFSISTPGTPPATESCRRAVEGSRDSQVFETPATRIGSWKDAAEKQHGNVVHTHVVDKPCRLLMGDPLDVDAEGGRPAVREVDPDSLTDVFEMLYSDDDYKEDGAFWDEDGYGDNPTFSGDADVAVDTMFPKWTGASVFLTPGTPDPQEWLVGPHVESPEGHNLETLDPRDENSCTHAQMVFAITGTTRRCVSTPPTVSNKPPAVKADYSKVTSRFMQSKSPLPAKKAATLPKGSTLFSVAEERRSCVVAVSNSWPLSSTVDPPILGSSSLLMAFADLCGEEIQPVPALPQQIKSQTPFTKKSAELCRKTTAAEAACRLGEGAVPRIVQQPLLTLFSMPDQGMGLTDPAAVAARVVPVQRNSSAATAGPVLQVVTNERRNAHNLYDGHKSWSGGVSTAPSGLERRSLSSALQQADMPKSRVFNPAPRVGLPLMQGARSFSHSAANASAIASIFSSAVKRTPGAIAPNSSDTGEPWWADAPAERAVSDSKLDYTRHTASFSGCGDATHPSSPGTNSWGKVRSSRFSSLPLSGILSAPDMSQTLPMLTRKPDFLPSTSISCPGKRPIATELRSSVDETGFRTTTTDQRSPSLSSAGGPECLSDWLSLSALSPPKEHRSASSGNMGVIHGSGGLQFVNSDLDEAGRCSSGTHENGSSNAPLSTAQQRARRASTMLPSDIAVLMAGSGSHSSQNVVQRRATCQTQSLPQHVILAVIQAASPVAHGSLVCEPEVPCHTTSAVTPAPAQRRATSNTQSDIDADTCNRFAARLLPGQRSVSNGPCSLGDGSSMTPTQKNTWISLPLEPAAASAVAAQASASALAEARSSAWNLKRAAASIAPTGARPTLPNVFGADPSNKPPISPQSLHPHSTGKYGSNKAEAGMRLAHSMDIERMDAYRGGFEERSTGPWSGGVGSNDSRSLIRRSVDAAPGGGLGQGNWLSADPAPLRAGSSVPSKFSLSAA